MAGDKIRSSGMQSPQVVVNGEIFFKIGAIIRTVVGNVCRGCIVVSTFILQF